MAGLFSKIQPSSTFLDAGIHDNCVISSYKSIDPAIKNKQNFITFVKLDDDNKEIGRRTVSWFQFDHNGDFVYQNLQEFMVQLVGILEVYYTPEEVDELFLPFRDTDIEDTSDIIDQIKRKSELKKIFENTREDLTKLLGPVVQAYEDGDYSKKSRLKLILKNSYVNPPNYGNFVESMSVSAEDTVLKMTIPEQKEIDKANAVLESNSTPEKKNEEDVPKDTLDTMENIPTKDLLTNL
jgi:hypothetical protein